MANFSWKKCLHFLNRKRLLSADLESTNLRRCLNRWDLTALGLGSSLGIGVYVLIGSVGLRFAGPSIVLSFVIAAVASMMAGLCFGEFGSRVPMAGSVYVYTYVTVGEFAAFINGWIMILEGVFGAASVARGLGLYVDSMLGNVIRDWSLSAVPISADSDLFASYFDFLSFFVNIFFGLLLAIGVRESSTVNNVFAGLNMIVIVFIVVVGAFKADFANWSIPMSEVPKGFGKGGFFPYGIGGMFKGAAMCFYGFVGFDVISFTGEEVRNPRKTIPESILLVLLAVLVSYISVSTIVTLMVPYYMLDKAAAVAAAFQTVGWNWARWIVSVGAVCGICSSLFAALFTLPRLLYAMASDGLLHHWFAHTIRQTPVFATVVPTIIIAILAAIIELEQLILMMCVGTLISYTIVAACVILLRYQSKILDRKTSYIKQALGCGKRTATKISARIVKYTLIVFTCFCIGTALIGVHTGWPLIPIVIMNIIIVLLLGIMSLQPQTTDSIPFKTPLVPMIPCLCIYVNVHLMILMNVQNWIRVLVWIIIGIPIYFICIYCYKQKFIAKSDPSLSHHSKNGKAPQIVVESPTPPSTGSKSSRDQSYVRTLYESKKQANVKQEPIIVQQLFIENNEEREAKIIDLLDQVLQAEEDSYVEQVSLKDDEEPVEDVMIPIKTTEEIPHRKSLSELSDAGSDASLGNQELSKYSVIALVHREDLPKVSEEEERHENDDEATDDDVDNIENEIEHEQVTAFNDSETNSRTDESGYSDTIDKNVLNDSVDDVREEVPYIPPPPPLDESYFNTPYLFKKSFSIPSRPNRQLSVEEEDKPRESVQSNGSTDDGNIIFGSSRQMKFMNKLNDIFQSKISTTPEEEQRRRSNSTGAMADNPESSNHVMMRERPSQFLDLKQELLSMHSVPNLRPVNVADKNSNLDSTKTDDESEDSSLSRDDLKNKLETIFATGGPKLLKPRLMKSNPPTPEEAYQTDASSTESITKLPKIEKNDTLKRQKDKFGAVLNSLRFSLNKDDVV